jgi:hypothetical protein
MTSPKPVRRDMLRGRKKFGERFIRIKAKSTADIPKKRSCQRTGLSLWMNSFFMMIIKIRR